MSNADIKRALETCEVSQAFKNKMPPEQPKIKKPEILPPTHPNELLINKFDVRSILTDNKEE